MTQSQQLFKLGATAILTHSDAFADGYCNGFAAYPATGLPHHSFTNTMLYEMIVSNILDVRASHEWNAGFIAGAFEGLRKGDTNITVPNAPTIHLGPVALRLDNWRFREGFLTGQEDWQADFVEHEKAPILTARDLLSSIAYQDPTTKRYILDEEALGRLEEMLGQLVGYLCAALFPTLSQNANAQVTEPLHSVAFQEA